MNRNSNDKPRKKTRWTFGKGIPDVEQQTNTDTQVFMNKEYMKNRDKGGFPWAI